MNQGQIVLLVYAILMIGGGMAGARAGSKVSMVAGSGSGLALLVALLWSSWNPAVGFWIGTGVGVALCAVFGIRLAQTRKAMPSGMLLAISLVAVILLAFAAGRVGRSSNAPPTESAIEAMPAVAALAGARADA